MEKHEKYRARVRVRLAKAFTSEDTEIRTIIGGRPVSMKSGAKDQPLHDAKWVEFNAGGFYSIEDAQEFGLRLKTIIDIAGFSNRLGIDVGDEQPGADMNEDWARSIGLITAEQRLHPNIHGLVVVPDDGLSLFPSFNARGRVTADPVSFLASLSELGDQGVITLGRAAPAVRVMNRALLSKEPLTQIVLAISMVEALGQEEEWTERQVRLLSDLASDLEARPDFGQEEQEVAAAIRRGMHRIGLRQGVLRVFARLDLMHLKKEWDRIYSMRSGVFHGTKALSDSEIGDLAHASISLAGAVLLALLGADGLSLPSNTASRYPASS